MPWIAGKRCQIVQIARVGQLVQIDDRLIALRQPVQYEIRPNEAGATGDQNHYAFSFA